MNQEAIAALVMVDPDEDFPSPKVSVFRASELEDMHPVEAAGNLRASIENDWPDHCIWGIISNQAAQDAMAASMSDVLSELVSFEEADPDEIGERLVHEVAKGIRVSPEQAREMLEEARE